MAEAFDDLYRRNISIDYSAEARARYWKLYADFGKLALQKEPKLRLLSIANSKDRPADLPT